MNEEEEVHQRSKVVTVALFAPTTTQGQANFGCEPHEAWPAAIRRSRLTLTVAFSSQARRVLIGDWFNTYGRSFFSVYACDVAVPCLCPPLARIASIAAAPRCSRPHI